MDSLLDWSDIIRKQGEEISSNIERGKKMVMEVDESFPLSTEAEELIEKVHTYTSGMMTVLNRGLSENQIENSKRDLIAFRQELNQIAKLIGESNE